MKYDAIVVGGGFFGTTIGLFLKEYFDDVVVLEKEGDILSRASLINQARVHNGYHYPRSLVTTFRSLVNFPKFILDFRHAIKDDFDKYYAIAALNSKVNAKQFYEIYKKMGAPIEIAQPNIKAFFSDELTEEVFKVKEFAFDAVILKEIILEKIRQSGCELRLNTKVNRVINGDKFIGVELENGEFLEAKFVFNCTYSNLNSILKRSNLDLLSLKHEITEMALIQMPKVLENISVTVMDGPFFSVMPFPSRGLYTLSHVRYTPHGSWIDTDDFRDAHKLLENFDKKSNFIYMINDAKRYMPALGEAVYQDSIFEIKTVLVKNEVNDGRPILFTRDYGIKNFSNIMGAKIDNIYEILDTIKEAKDFLGIKKRSFWSIFGE